MKQGFDDKSPFFRAEDLRAGYGAGDILQGISFELKPGTITCVLGENGCGKTTLLRAIAGTLPSTGRIELAGEDIRRWRAKERAQNVAVLAQQGGAYFPYSVRETILMGREAGVLHTDITDEELIENLLTEFELHELADGTIDSLSGGELQRVFLARAFAQNARLLLLDEPTNHLDVSHQIDLEKQLRSYVADGDKAILVVMHDILLARRLGDQAILLKKGRVVAAGSKGEVYGRDVLRQAYDADVLGFLEGLAAEG